MIDLVDSLEPRYELRLVVGIEGSASDPAPADASDDVREALRALPPPNTSERYSTLAALLDKAGAGCDGLSKAVADTMMSTTPSAMSPLGDTMRRCGCQTVDVPAIEAIVAAVGFAVGQPALGWMPLDLSVTTGTMQQFATTGSSAPAPEANLGAACRTAADCIGPASACVPFDADGTWHPAGALHCTRPCGAGCPRGFRCTREARITGAGPGGLEGAVVSTWCGPVAPRGSPK